MTSQPPPTVHVAIGIIEQDGRILICQRPQHATLGGLWEFPGGKCEPGESPRACLLRELDEELGIDVVPTAPLPPILHDYGHVIIQLHPFLCRISGGVPHPHAAQTLRWVEADRLSDHPFPAANDSLLRVLRTHFSAVNPIDFPAAPP